MSAARSLYGPESPVAALRRASRAWFLRRFLLPAADRVLGQSMIERLGFLEKAQWWPQERIDEARRRSLQQLIQVAYEEVPFYRSLLEEAGVKPEEMTRPEDLQRLPMVTKDRLRPAYPALTVRSTGQRTYETASSGSTGANFYVREDAETAGLYRACFLVGAEWSGWQIGDRHLQTGITPHRGWTKAFKDWLLSCHYVNAFDLTDANLDTNLDLMDRYNIRFVWGYPGSLYYLARRARERGWNRPITSAVTWGDNLYEHYRSEIETVFSTRVYDAYGCGEGIWATAQCGHGRTYHVHALDVIIEYVDEDGMAVPSGQPGNILLTRLHPGPMPLIRYRVGDVGIGSSRQCSCGREMEVMESLQGRDTDVVLTPSGNRLVVHFFTGTLEHFPEIVMYQVVQERAGEVLIRIVPGPGYSADVQQQIIQRLWDKGAAGLQVEIELVKEIPTPPSGKRRFVIGHLARAPRGNG